MPKKQIKLKFISMPITAKTNSTLMIKHKDAPKNFDENDLLDYRNFMGSGGKHYDMTKACRVGYGVLPVLKELWNRKLDKVTMAYVYSLNPTEVRVATSIITLDWSIGRVTIHARKIGKSYFVRRIEKETKVLLPKGVAHHQALELAVDWGINSPQVKWHDNADGYLSSKDGYFKSTKKGHKRWDFKPGRNPELFA